VEGVSRGAQTQAVPIPGGPWQPTTVRPRGVGTPLSTPTLGGGSQHLAGSQKGRTAQDGKGPQTAQSGNGRQA
jgi:hypothetical protein